MEKMGKDLVSKDHYATTTISQILQALTLRRDKLKDSTASRRKRLDESKKLHQFSRNVYEVSEIRPMNILLLYFPYSLNNLTICVHSTRFFEILNI